MMALGICEKGCYREENQDAILIRYHNDSGLFIVADGVGSSEYGATASSFLIDSFNLWWKEYFIKNSRLSFTELFSSIKTQTECLNQKLYRKYGAGKCCSTISLLFIHKFIYGYLSSGDSRIYFCDKSGVRLLTKDDVWENQPDASLNLMNKGKIMSAVGGYDYLEYSCATGRVFFKNSFLLCSDGIYKYIDENLIKEQLRYTNRCLWLKRNVIETVAQAAIKGKTTDNYSLILVKL